MEWRRHHTSTKPTAAARTFVRIGLTIALVGGIFVSVAATELWSHSAPGLAQEGEIAQTDSPLPLPGETMCHAVSDSGAANQPRDSDAGDSLVRIRRAGSAGAVATEVGFLDGGRTRAVEAIAIRPGVGLHAYDPATEGGRILLIDTTDGSLIRNIATGLGPADIDGLTFANVADRDLTNDRLWATERRTDGPDLLIELDPDTGLPVAPAIVIDTSAAGALVDADDVDDIAWDPASQMLFATVGESGNNALVTIDPSTGAASLVGSLAVGDVEGLGFSNVGEGFGQLFGSTGKDTDSNANSLITIDPVTAATGQPVDLSLISGLTDFEAIDCLSIPSYQAIGDRVWLDSDADGVQGADDPGIAGVSIEVLSTNGVVIATTETDGDGLWAVPVLPGTYAARVVPTTLPGGLVPTLPGIGDATLDSDAGIDGIDPWTSGVIDVPVGADRTDIDFGARALVGSLEVVKTINGLASPVAPGPLLDPGTTVDFGFEVRNNGESTLGSIEVSDDLLGQIPCPLLELAPGQSMICGLTAAVDTGAHRNVVNVFASDERGQSVNARSEAHYFGAVTSLVVNKTVVDVDGRNVADTVVDVGAPLTFVYEVTNSGNVTLTDIVAIDDVEGTVVCPAPVLAPGTRMTCTLDRSAVAGEYRNVVAVTASGPDGRRAESSDETRYVGVNPPAIEIIKRTNGLTSVEGEPAVALSVGAPVEWTYEVRNTGGVALSGIVVLDDREGAASCPLQVLEPGASMICSIAGFVIPGAYSNAGVARATTPDGAVIETSDDASYVGVVGAVGDFVWLDVDRDGVQDPDEPGVEGVVVRVQRDQVLVATAVTDVNGRWMVDGLHPGSSQRVSFDVPLERITVRGAGSDPARDSDVEPATGRIETVVVPAGGADLNLDLGLVPEDVRISIGDLVWFDENANGLFDDERPVRGAELTLRDGVTGAEIASTISDREGRYRFEDVPGWTDYEIEIQPRPGFVLTTKGVGGLAADHRNSDFDQRTGRASVNAQNVDIDSIDAGLTLAPGFMSGLVWMDDDADGQRDLIDSGDATTEPIVPGVTVVLERRIGDDAEPVDALQTDNGGRWRFEIASPGEYRIRVELSAPWEFTNAAGSVDALNNGSVVAPDGSSEWIEISTFDDIRSLDAGVLARPAAIDLAVFIQGVVVDMPSEQPIIEMDPADPSMVEWGYRMFNPGPWPLRDVVLMDNRIGEVCVVDELGPGDRWDCSRTETARLGNQSLDAVVRAEIGPGSDSIFDPAGRRVTGPFATAASGYRGVEREQVAAPLDPGPVFQGVFVTATPVQTPAPTATAVPASTAVATSTAVPTSTSVPAATTVPATPTTLATATPGATAAPTPSPVPATPTPEVLGVRQPAPTATPVPTSNPTPTFTPAPAPTAVPAVPLAVTGRTSTPLLLSGLVCVAGGLALVLEGRRRELAEVLVGA